jgi:hypothetical protein
VRRTVGRSSIDMQIRSLPLDRRSPWSTGSSAAPGTNAEGARVTPLPGSPSPIPGHIDSADSTAIPGAVLNATNQWIDSNGPLAVLVTAGAAGNDSSVGRFVIVRENLAAVDLATGVQHGRPQRTDEVDVPGSGAVTITAAPEGPGAESSGLNGDLEFQGTSGVTGTLHLSNDTVTTNSRH